MSIGKVKKLICWMFGHNYGIVRRFSSTTRCLWCIRCQEFFAMNDRVKALVPWDTEFCELYDYYPGKFQKFKPLNKN